MKRRLICERCGAEGEFILPDNWFLNVKIVLCDYCHKCVIEERGDKKWWYGGGRYD